MVCPAYRFYEITALKVCISWTSCRQYAAYQLPSYFRFYHVYSGKAVYSCILMNTPVYPQLPIHESYHCLTACDGPEMTHLMYNQVQLWTPVSMVRAHEASVTFGAATRPSKTRIKVALNAHMNHVKVKNVTSGSLNLSVFLRLSHNNTE